MMRDYILEDVRRTIRQQIELDKGTGCEIPRLDPFNRDFIKAYRAMPPCTGMTWIKCYMSECGPTREMLDTMEDILCWYRDIIFVNDYHYIIEEPTEVEGDDIYILNASDYVKVKCTAKRSNSVFYTSWNGYGYGVRRAVPRRESPRGRERAASVLILGIDSASKNEVLRQMPRTMRKLEEFGAVILNKYNILGDGTPAALYPVLTGHTEPELPEARKGFLPKRYLEEFPWIFYKLTEDGYRTAFFEDRTDVGTFQLRFHGWQKSPTDHYARALFSNYEYENTDYWFIRPEFRSMHNCFGAEYTHRMMLNLTDQFWHLDGKKFSLTWFVDLNHEDKIYLYSADSDFEEFLISFADRGFLKNTMVIMMSDHGNRYSKYRQFLQGKLEERLPFLAIILPEDLKRARPTALSNLQSNVDVLTTAHDLHATILDVIGLSQYANPYSVNGTELKRGISLLEKIPPSRSCSEADVLPHWCTCVNWEKLPEQDPMRLQVASALLNAINEIILSAKQYCAKRSLTSIEWVMIAKPRRQLIDYRGPVLSQDFVKKSIDAFTDDYQVKIVTSPGDGVFEATLTYVKKKGTFRVSAQDISRITKRLEKTPTLSWRKASIQDWLRSKNVHYEEKETKSHLMEKVKQIKSDYQSYVIDEMAKKKGITVLRLPPYHCELNPIELVWADIKGYVARNNTTFKFGDLKKLLTDGINQITKEKWKNCVGHVLKEEEKMRGLDNKIDKTVDKFIINVTDSDSSNVSSDSSTDKSDSDLE